MIGETFKKIYFLLLSGTLPPPAMTPSLPVNETAPSTQQFYGPTAPSPTPEPEYYLGELIAGTYCSRIFSDCDRKHCRLQSPNYPGVYPRNLTCYYAVRQHEIPPGTLNV